jgi:hypothetical protein
MSALSLVLESPIFFGAPCDGTLSALISFERSPMKFSLEIGVTEKHRLDCETSPLWGLFVIKVDDVERAKVRHMLLAPRRQKHSLDIGIQERLQVTVEKVRGIFSGDTHRVFVNGRLVKCFSGAKAVTEANAPEGLTA